MQATDVLQEEEDKYFEKWLAMETEFSKEEFFAKIRSSLSGFDLSEKLDGDVLRYDGITKPVEIHHYDDDGNLSIKWLPLKVHILARYDKKMCSYDGDLFGHGEFRGQCHPLKSYEDLKRVVAMYADYLKPKNNDYGEQGNLFEDLCLFTGGI